MGRGTLALLALLFLGCAATGHGHGDECIDIVMFENEADCTGFPGPHCGPDRVLELCGETYPYPEGEKSL